MIPSNKFQEGWNKERRFQRAGCSIPAEAYYDQESFSVQIKTIGGGGAFLQSSKFLSENSVIELKFQLPDGREINALARIVWTNTPINQDRNLVKEYSVGFAVEFERISNEDRAAIDLYVRFILRTLRAIAYELKNSPVDKEKVRELFKKIKPDDSLHLNHIKKVVQKELRYFRLKK